jgi:hypothetical protein
MLGWDITVYRGGTIEYPESSTGSPRVVGGAILLYIPPTPDISLIRPISDAAIEELCAHGYPCLYQVRAGDLPYELEVPSDELVYVEAWDQS